MPHFQGEDLIVINIDEVKTTGRVVIQNARINRFRNDLRQHGVLSDLGLREFETLRFRYPRNIKIESHSITIENTDSFVRVFERRIPELGTRLKSVTIIWEGTE